MSLYEIIKALQNAQGNIAKQTILNEHKDNALFKAYMKAVYDPAINYYQKKIPILPDWDNSGTHGLNIEWINELIHQLSNRKVTGTSAKTYLGWFSHVMNTESRELLELIIDRSIGASVGDTMVLKTWPDLYFTVPYQRCSLLDKKAKEKFSKLPLMYVQEKCDGSFLYLVKEAGKPAEAITRAGSRYPREFAEKLAEGVPDGVVLIGELLVYDIPAGCASLEPKILDRQTGNGMLNSILKGGDADYDNYSFKMTAWDIVTPEEFKKGKSEDIYDDRLTNLKYVTNYDSPNNIEFVVTKPVKSLDEAYIIYSEFTAQGKEGAVLKTPDFIWKDGTSKDCVKMKVEFEIELKITGVVEGTGKASGMTGALQLISSDGKIVTDVGTGFSDDLRKVFWMHKHDMIGKIITVKANDIISKRGSDTFSLFLPVFVEERLDKTEANSYDECVAILNAAKGLK